MSRSKENLADFLRFYISLPETVRYAVLVKGMWGAGKTFSVRSALDEIYQPKRVGEGGWLRKTKPSRPSDHYLVISLYGINSIREIDAAILAALYPWSKHDGVRVMGTIGRAVLTNLKIEIPKLSPSEFARSLASKLLVFDDLERANLDVKVLLGYINQLVEIDGRKVILIANSGEFEQDEYFEATKEKLVGRTIEVEPDFESAYKDFVSELNDPTISDLMLRFRTDISEIFANSESQNLRVLRQSIWDFSRVFSALNSEHLGNDRAILQFMQQFFAFSIEHKLGRISGTHLINRRNRFITNAMGQAEDAPTDPFVRASQRYPGVEMTEGPFTDEVLVDVLEKGLIEPNSINHAFNSSAFVRSPDESPWKILWHSDSRENAELVAAQDQILEWISTREPLDTGIIMHICGLLLRSAEIGALDWTEEQVVIEMKAYIDDLLESGSIEDYADDFMGRYAHGAYDGLGFVKIGTPNFREMWDYLQTSRIEATRRRNPEIAEQLVDLIKTDVAEFTRKISYGYGSGGTYANRPIFADTDAAIFARNLVELPATTFQSVCMAFGSRYDNAKLVRELSDERQWVETVFIEALLLSRFMAPFERDRIVGFVHYAFGSRLPDAN
ncbi:hypothetical protein T8S45_01725 [Blastomonas marina]|uniref:P-loop NTPase fold protein n=1 Tax=Blastomonas marina TaxID=1867408 RepID=UPI002AC989F1|nr:P-loop NTPase fold protein [Blastomonas marina]WPZ04277.1 hypothetical protein T8S45_01725 [Blastomonas marina]